MTLQTVLILDCNPQRLAHTVDVIGHGLTVKVITCSAPAGCLDMVARYRPDVALICSEFEVVAGVTLATIVKNICPHTVVCIAHANGIAKDSN